MRPFAFFLMGVMIVFALSVAPYIVQVYRVTQTLGS